MPFQASADRYKHKAFRRCGKSGLELPKISLGLWQNFGGTDVFETGRAIILRAFDRGVTHFDLANNYGPPPGSAEENFGRWMARDLLPYRDEIVVSTKAGWDMWPGPYGNFGSRKHLIASCDASLRRMGLDYVDIFYHHRPDPHTPLEETMQALADITRSGRALYIGLSSYSPSLTRTATAILKNLGVPLLIHQPSYSMLNRWIEVELLDTLEELGIGCIAFSPLAQGLLTERYLGEVPKGSRAAQNGSFSQTLLTDENLARIRGLAGIAKERGQSLAQIAIAWAIRDPRVTSTLVGARTVDQLDNSLDSLAGPPFSAEDLRNIDRYAQDGSVDLWRSQSLIEG